MSYYYSRLKDETSQSACESKLMDQFVIFIESRYNCERLLDEAKRSQYALRKTQMNKLISKRKEKRHLKFKVPVLLQMHSDYELSQVFEKFLCRPHICHYLPYA